MTREEAILRIEDHIEVHKYREVTHAIKILEALNCAIEALQQSEPQWIPCHDPSDLPKDKRIWITYECDVCGYVFRFVKDVVWDMTEWSDNVSGVVAYMPYVEPEPYEESGRKE